MQRGDLHPACLPREMRRRHLGYAGFLCCGSVCGIALALNWLPTNSWLYVGLAALFRLPVLMVFNLGALVGATFSVVAWREWQLPVLTGLTVITAFLPWMVQRWPAIPDPAVGAYLVSYVLLALGLPARWYLIDRRRLLGRHPPHIEPEWL
jgi:hypothetical protein